MSFMLLAENGTLVGERTRLTEASARRYGAFCAFYDWCIRRSNFTPRRLRR